MSNDDDQQAANPLQTLISTLDLPFTVDGLVANVIRALLENGFTLVARPLVRLSRYRSRDDVVGGGQGQTPDPDPPLGPFRLGPPSPGCDMLIYVPRSLESYFIDDVTGRYGYSHVAVDVGEVDIPTGKRVITESTIGVGTHRSFLDKYGKRGFIRIPLAEAGVDGGPFRDCVQDKIGEPYDNAEALTWGAIDDPAKQVCSDLAADCLPAQMRKAIVADARAGRLGRFTVSIHGPARLPLHIFVSPNGFARFFGARPGHKVDGPDELVHPRLRRSSPNLSRLWVGLLAGVAVAAGLWIGWQLLRPPEGEQSAAADHATSLF